MQTPHVEPPRLSIDDLCATTGFTRRTVRYYLQHHLSQLLRIKQLSEAGVSLERIRLVLGGAESPVATPAPAIGSVAVKSHLLLAPGITVVIDPHEAHLSPEGLRELITALTDAHQHITKVSK